MKPVDWIIAFMPLVFVLAVSWYAMRYMKSVTHFLSGGRVGGRYLLAVAGGELQSGAVVFVALFEVIGKSGLSTNWWNMISVPVWLFLTVSGFVLYRYRQTRAMTLAQFFELRYSKSFRFFTGILGFIAGVLNFGIIPAIGARFLVYFLGLPPEFTLWGFTLPTYIPLMGLFISVAACITLSGGIISLMIANCIEGILSQLFYLIVIGALLLTFNWHQISQTLSSAPPGHSMINPFDSFATSDFNLWYVIMGLLLAVYARGSWQNASGYGAAALSAHEARMAGVLGSWRESGKKCRRRPARRLRRHVSLPSGLFPCLGKCPFRDRLHCQPSIAGADETPGSDLLHASRRSKGRLLRHSAYGHLWRRCNAPALLG